MEFPLYGTILKSPLNCVSYTVSIRVSPDSPVAPLPRYTSKAWYSAGHTGGPLSRNGPWARHAEVLTVSCILLRNAASSPAFHQANIYILQISSSSLQLPEALLYLPREKPSLLFPTLHSSQHTPHWRTDHTVPSPCFTGLFSQRTGAPLITGLSPGLRSQ